LFITLVCKGHVCEEPGLVVPNFYFSHELGYGIRIEFNFGTTSMDKKLGYNKKYNY
jgi:hypothetical protein